LRDALRATYLKGSPGSCRTKFGEMWRFIHSVSRLRKAVK
jgi:hypothetical protein